jgi:hypothetical protein
LVFFEQISDERLVPVRRAEAFEQPRCNPRWNSVGHAISPFKAGRPPLSRRSVA